MLEIPVLVVLIPALPLLAAVATAALGPRVLGRRSHWPTIVALVLSTVLSAVLAREVRRADRIARWQHQTIGGVPNEQPYVGYERIVTLWSWADVPGAFAPATNGPRATAGDVTSRAGDAAAARRPLDLRVALRADGLSSVMLVIVTTVSLLVAVYSIGYMCADRGYWRFFAYLSLFVFSMTMLVSVSNFLLLYVFWEAVGLCSYLLIGFWYEKPAAAAAGKKAFLVNRVGDFGFALGVFLLWTTYGTLNFHDTAPADPADAPAGFAATAWTATASDSVPRRASPSAAPAISNPPSAPGAVEATNSPARSFIPGILGKFAAEHPGFHTGGAVGLAICLLLLLGACGKSAQFPLHVWLPDAMEGPTPVSALIHAATMVTAGVYMVARCAPLWAVSPAAQQAVAVVGGLTALLAAVIALGQTDLKRILAYSTISQLGYMFLALGAGTLLGATAGMFHLATHAVFKALLFLAAGSVMHAMGGVIDLKRLGGLRRRMPATHATFLVGCLALAGVAPLSGFWSKDAILAAIDHEVHNAARGAAGQSLYFVLFASALATAALTALYTFRAYFLAFWGAERIPAEAGAHAHESPRVMTAPLWILAAGALGLGGYLAFSGAIDELLRPTPSLRAIDPRPLELPDAAIGEPTSPPAAAGEPAAGEAHATHARVAVLSTAAALAGLFLAAVFYGGGAGRLAAAIGALSDLLGLGTLVRRKFYLDELYATLIVAPLRAIAAALAWADHRILDALVDAVGRAAMLLGAALRPMHCGLIPSYALAMILGLLVLLGAMFW